jgi:hypothetical protein
MSAVAIRVAPTLFDDLQPGAGVWVSDRPGGERKPIDHVGGEPTLDDLIVGVWEGLTAQVAVGCPVCGGDMHPEFGPHSRPVAGRCSSCGSVLS